jgi:hypothetical protein
MQFAYLRRKTRQTDRHGCHSQTGTGQRQVINGLKNVSHKRFFFFETVGERLSEGEEKVRKNNNNHMDYLQFLQFLAQHICTCLENFFLR